MKKQYQISKRRAVERFQKWAEGNPVPIQLTFPTAGIAELAQQSLGDLLRSVGRTFMETVMEAEVMELAGERSNPVQTAMRTDGVKKPASASSMDSACRLIGPGYAAAKTTARFRWAAMSCFSGLRWWRKRSGRK